MTGSKEPPDQVPPPKVPGNTKVSFRPQGVYMPWVTVESNNPAQNFFSSGGYYRNTVVRDRTAAELLRALEERMEVNMKKPGAVEFAQIFDEVARR